MGGNESAMAGAHGTPSDMCLPVVGTRMNDEKVMSQLRAASQLKTPTKRNHIVRTAFTAIWSQIQPNGPLTPHSRVGQFYSTCTELGIAITGLGITDDNTYLNDIWALNQQTLTWTNLQITGDQISPRANARATCLGHILYIFGGACEPVFYNDLFSIDLTTGQCTLIQTTGDIPSPRSAPIVGGLDGKIYVWGGYDSLWPSDLHVLDLSTNVWKAYPQEIQGRTGVGYTLVGDKIYCFGSAKTGGLLQIDLTELKVSLVQTTGAEPPSSLANSSMIFFDHYLIVIGGKFHVDWTLIYACDITRFWWFVLHVLPDGETVSQTDGCVSDLGLFMLPRAHSMGASWCPTRREIVTFLGFPTKDPPPLYILSVGEAMGVLNMRSDMLEMLKH
ncbi:Kelch motif family protein [Trichomonas vaginalis G3]|uniref:Kelch motif family protein n=1 Tax=Trichomonas vaginalis (strain ATCC PRA-98 / G3) TaxID=412133 RepID=A2DLV0_TRIV3|nr:nitrile biosynthetic process [Trichomonas vaginalis G3]EAY18553.1 Kelch motif family protein [Trichomonas vaginalis G3]KAI5491576.1 nitrile biosynthetic process [Trichomonas vaginalis G3]|eukprot:XP_001579539.1 Kelch motif family protein [Trichomonas vaginalis G3]